MPTHISLVLLTSLLIFNGCANRAKSQRMLHERSKFSSIEKPSLYFLGDYSKEPDFSYRPSRMAKIWIHRHKLSNEDYFGGGWIYAVIKNEEWVPKKTTE